MTYIPGAIIIETTIDAAKVRARDRSAEICTTSNAVTLEAKDQEGRAIEIHYYRPLQFSPPGITARENLRNEFSESIHQDEIPWLPPVKMNPCPPITKSC